MRIAAIMHVDAHIPQKETGAAEAEALVATVVATILHMITQFPASKRVTIESTLASRKSRTLIPRANSCPMVVSVSVIAVVTLTTALGTARLGSSSMHTRPHSCTRQEIPQIARLQDTARADRRAWTVVAVQIS